MSGWNETGLRRRLSPAVPAASHARVCVLPVLLFCATLAMNAAANSTEMMPSALTSPSDTSPNPPVVIISDLTDYADDNIAILMLLRSGKVDIRGLITTSGNACAHRGAIEARRLLEAAGAAVPVVCGFPLAWHAERRRFYEEVQRPARPANAYAGALGGGSSCDEEADNAASDPDAADFLIEQARGAKGGLRIILIGPATVLAEAMRRDRQFPNFIRRVDAMGGAIRVPGNVTPHAEFNIWFDAEAMASVLASPIPVTLVPLDATTGVAYDASHQKPNFRAGFAGEHLAAYLEKAERRRSPVPMWDEVLAAVVIEPSLVEKVEELSLAVMSNKDEHYGKVLASPVISEGGARPVQVVTKVRAEGVRQLVNDLLRRGD